MRTCAVCETINRRKIVVNTVKQFRFLDKETPLDSIFMSTVRFCTILDNLDNFAQFCTILHNLDKFRKIGRKISSGPRTQIFTFPKCLDVSSKKLFFTSLLTHTNLPKTLGDHSENLVFLIVWFPIC